MTKLWAAKALTPAGWCKAVVIEIDVHGRIARVASDHPAVGERYSVMLPAPVNGHSHAFQRAMAGLTEMRGPGARDEFWSWRERMYQFAEILTPDDLEAIAAFAQMEMLEAGYAAVAEFHYLHHGPGGTPYTDPSEMSARIVAAASHSGIGLLLLPVLYEQQGVDGGPLVGVQKRFGCTVEQYANLLDAVSVAVGTLPDDSGVGVAAHSLRAVSRKSLADIERLLPAAPLHMHLAEQSAEVSDIEAAWGMRPIRWMLDHYDMSQRWCLVHCTQATEEEARALAHVGAVVGLCPITESNLGDGIFRAVSYLGATGRFCIGSDSNVRISQVEEYRTLEYSQRLRDHSRVALALNHRSTGQALFEGACSGGALAAGRHSGKIAVGAWADLMELDGDDSVLHGLTEDTILDAWIFAGTDRLIRNVWSAGRHMVCAGQHIRRRAIESRYRLVQERLRRHW